MKTQAVVVSVGARTPIGLGALATGFFHRAAAVTMQPTPFTDSQGEAVTMALLPTLDPALMGARRALELAGFALDEALESFGMALAQLRVKLFVCLDEYIDEAASGDLAARDVADSLYRRLSSRVQAGDIGWSARGPAALGGALGGLIDELHSGAIDALVVGGTHTDYDPARIAQLEQSGRLFSTDRLDAVVPGEGAAFAVLMRPGKAKPFGLRGYAALHAVAQGMERARPDNDESAFEALGLTAAVRAAGQPLADSGRRAGWMLTDLAQETMRWYEFQAVMTRTTELWCEPQYCDCPAQRLGYLGATALPLHLVLAAEGWRRGWAPHPVAMAMAGSDGGQRAALLLSAHDLA